VPAKHLGEVTLPNTLIIYAPNVHSGGGAVLLNSILNVNFSFSNVEIFVDSRFDLPVTLSNVSQIHKIKPSLISRLNSERKLQRLVKCDDVVLCFSGLPTLLPNQGKSVLLVQNQHLLVDVSNQFDSYYSRVKAKIKQWLLSYGLKHTHEVVVQTLTMKSLFVKRFGDVCDIAIFPFIREPSKFARKSSDVKQTNGDITFDFIYPATTGQHKNHINLVKAWCLLAQENAHPTLCLTLDKSSNNKTIQKIVSLIEGFSLKIELCGLVSKEKITSFYQNSKACIYPSLCESFGLPLIEARQAGLSIIAGELDYVRDLVDPEATFDPRSPLSIARAVLRFLDHPCKEVSLKSSQDFIDSLGAALQK